MKKVQEKDLYKLKNLFNDIRFYMGNSVLDGTMGEAYADNPENPNFAILLVRRYCFISGNINNDKLEKLINNSLKDRILVPDDNIKKSLKEIYKDNIIIGQRYSIKKDPEFNVNNLKNYTINVPENYTIKIIDTSLAQRIKNEKYIMITDDYEKYGIGYCCLYNDKIIGVASSNIFYKNGIEVTIKVNEEHRQKGIATILASNLILKCIEKHKTVSWDAANINSLHLAEKLGFEFDSQYETFRFPLP